MRSQGLPTDGRSNCVVRYEPVFTSEDEVSDFDASADAA
jgi:hypothetical protein